MFSLRKNSLKINKLKMIKLKIIKINYLQIKIHHLLRSLPYCPHHHPHLSFHVIHY